MRLRTLAIVLTLGTALAAAAGAAEPEARAIMEKNFFVTKVSAMQADSTMTLVNDRGQTRERKSKTYTLLQPNGVDSKLVVRFTTPTDIKGTSFLQIEHSETDDDQWIYLPALKRSRRLVANNKKDSFVGSDFSYGDISLPKVDRYKHRLLRSEAVDGHDCYVIESTPADDTVRRDSGYARKITWVQQDDFLEDKVEYYDLSDRLLKVQLVGEHRLIEPAKGRWIALRREMVNQQTGHRTLFVFDHVEPGVALSDSLFTTREIERE